MNRLPSKSTRNAPSPRTASEISGCWPCDSGPSHITVGWNCTNSRSRSVAPARSASAIPSPVDTAGLVDCAKTCPSPPLASTTARQRTAPTPSRWPSPITCRVSPATPPSASSSRSTASACWITSMPGSASTAAISARWISAPVASPPACAIRSRWWPPSRVSESSPSGVWSKLGAERDQLAHRVRSLGDQDAYGVPVAGARRRRRGCPARAARGCPPGRARRRCRPGPTGSTRRPSTSLVTSRTVPPALELGPDPQRRRQPGDARADDDHVGARRPARRGRAQAPRERRRTTGSAMRQDYLTRQPTGSVRPARSPRTSPEPATASAGSKPVARILLSASTNTTCGWSSLASAVSIWP